MGAGTVMSGGVVSRTVMLRVLAGDETLPNPSVAVHDNVVVLIANTLPGLTARVPPVSLQVTRSFAVTMLAHAGGTSLRARFHRVLSVRPVSPRSICDSMFRTSVSL